MVLATVLICSGIFLWSRPSLAAITDSDMNSLTDKSETATYRTKPLIFDMDGDGARDRGVVINGTDQLDPKISRLLVRQPTQYYNFYGPGVYIIVVPIVLLIGSLILFLLSVAIRIIARTLVPKWQAWRATPESQVSSTTTSSSDS